MSLSTSLKTLAKSTVTFAILSGTAGISMADNNSAPGFIDEYTGLVNIQTVTNQQIQDALQISRLNENEKTQLDLLLNQSESLTTEQIKEGVRTCLAIVHRIGEGQNVIKDRADTLLEIANLEDDVNGINCDISGELERFTQDVQKAIQKTVIDFNADLMKKGFYVALDGTALTINKPEILPKYGIIQNNGENIRRIDASGNVVGGKNGIFLAGSSEPNTEFIVENNAVLERKIGNQVYQYRIILIEGVQYAICVNDGNAEYIPFSDLAEEADAKTQAVTKKIVSEIDQNTTKITETTEEADEIISSIEYNVSKNTLSLKRTSEGESTTAEVTTEEILKAYKSLSREKQTLPNAVAKAIADKHNITTYDLEAEEKTRINGLAALIEALGIGTAQAAEREKNTATATQKPTTDATRESNKIPQEEELPVQRGKSGGINDGAGTEYNNKAEKSDNTDGFLDIVKQSNSPEGMLIASVDNTFLKSLEPHIDSLLSGLEKHKEPIVYTLLSIIVLLLLWNFRPNPKQRQKITTQIGLLWRKLQSLKSANSQEVYAAAESKTENIMTRLATGKRSNGLSSQNNGLGQASINSPF